MEQPFVYGKSVDGEYFTDREFETKRLLLNFENGINSILISPRRMGKTSLVKHVAQLVDQEHIKVVFVDAYKCRDEYDFYEILASSVIQATSSKLDKMLENAKEFLLGIAPQIHYSPEPNTDFTLSLGVSRRTNSPEELLSLPEKIAQKQGVKIVVCVDEFQQIGEMPNSVMVQKTIRSVWQHHRLTSYCLFGSKRHVMSTLFSSRSLPFYQFGDLFYLKKIPTEKWVPFIIRRFEMAGKLIEEQHAMRICQTVDNYSAYVQQLSWNIFAVAGKVVTDDDFQTGLNFTMEQVSPLFVEQTEGLSAFQLEFLRAVALGHHRDFTNKEVTSKFRMGSRSNIDKMRRTLVQRELLEMTDEDYFFADPLFSVWFKRHMM